MAKGNKGIEDLPKLILVIALLLLILFCAGLVRFEKIDLSHGENIGYLFDLTGYCLGTACLIFVFFISENIRFKRRVKVLEELLTKKND